MKKSSLLLTIIALSSLAGAHCQIPCGIYDDAARFTAMKEHVTTIEKSMKLIIETSPDSPAGKNQLVRWVSNKELHADQLTEIVTAYFLSQRIKSTTEQYEEQLKTLHAILVETMKSKQTVELEHVAKLRTLIQKFEALYFHGH